MSQQNQTRSEENRAYEPLVVGQWYRHLEIGGAVYQCVAYDHDGFVRVTEKLSGDTHRIALKSATTELWARVPAP